MIARLLGCLLCVPFFAQANPTKIKKINLVGSNPVIDLPAGEYRCSMGSYRYKACTVAHVDGVVRLTVTEGARFPFTAELWSSDDKGHIALDGRLTDPNALCPTCPDDKVGIECPGTVEIKKSCAQQALRAMLKRQRNGVWVGQLHQYLVRGIYAKGTLTGHYNLGIAETFRLWPPKTKAARSAPKSRKKLKNLKKGR